ncbi:hypothetical protein ACFJGW_14315 [Burkholderiaceae bacterium UC74_6]
MNQNRRHLLTLLPSLGLLSLSPAALARDEDEGEWQILGARYGTPDRNVDVTPRLKELARRDARFRLENDVFQVDPAFGQVKVLRIFARGRDGQVRHFEYAEHSWVDGRMFTGWRRGDWNNGGWDGGWDVRPPQGPGYGPGRGRLEIISATYGTRRRNIDVTDRLRDFARDGRVDFEVSNEAFGRDPAYNERKSLVVVYRADRGGKRTVEVNEGDRIRLP